METEESIRQHLYQLETRLFEPGVRHLPSDVAKLLADDFIEFGGTEIYNKQSIIDALAKELPVRISISNFKMTLLAPDVALVTYRAAIIYDEKEPAKHSLRSSIWKLMKREWKMVFHQGTAIVSAKS